MKKCPYCAESIQDEAVFCRHCRRPLPAEAVLPVIAPLESPAAEANEPDARLALEKKQRRTRGWLIFNSIFIAAAIAFGYGCRLAAENITIRGIGYLITGNVVWFLLMVVVLVIAWLLYKKQRFGWAFWLSFLFAFIMPFLIVLIMPLQLLFLSVVLLILGK